VRDTPEDEIRPAGRPGGVAVTSVAAFFLVLAPALVIVTGAEVLPQGAAGVQGRAYASARPAAEPAVQNARIGWSVTGGRVPSGGQRQLSPGRASAASDGTRLLAQAASAGRAVPYQGVQIISWWSPGGTGMVAVNVTHQPRSGTLLQTIGAVGTPGGESLIADERGAQLGDVLGVTEQTLDLLSANYQVIAAGTGSACDRPAEIVEAVRGDGTLAAKFWLDNVTKVPLRRELFDDRSRMINESTFAELKLGPPAASASMGSGSSVATAARPWNALSPAGLRRLRTKGWPLPAVLPGGLMLFNARQAVTASGPVFQLGYSDGLSGVSLFVQRGGLSRKLAGWRETDVAGRTVYARDPIGQGLTWASQGHVFTIIADAPVATIDAAVKALPHDARRGFWSRVGHGFGRLVSWMDPFG